MVSLRKRNILGSGRNCRNIEQNKRQSKKTRHDTILNLYNRLSKISMTSPPNKSLGHVLVPSLWASTVAFRSIPISNDQTRFKSQTFDFGLSQDSSVKDQSLAFQPGSTPPESLGIGGKSKISIHCRIATVVNAKFPHLFPYFRSFPGSIFANLHGDMVQPVSSSPIEALKVLPPSL